MVGQGPASPAPETRFVGCPPSSSVLAYRGLGENKSPRVRSAGEAGLPDLPRLPAPGYEMDVSGKDPLEALNLVIPSVEGRLVSLRQHAIMDPEEIVRSGRAPGVQVAQLNVAGQ